VRLADEQAERKEFLALRDKADELVRALPTQHEYFSQMRRQQSTL
jgi:hypothetical protein